MAKITWTNETRTLSQLTPWSRNPRQIKSDQAKRLAQSFAEFGQVETIAIGPAGEVYNGHQRLNVLMDKHGPDHVVEVRVSSRELTEKEREKLTVYLHKGAAGEWNFDTLANEFELDDLLEWGFREGELMGSAIPSLDSIGSLDGGNYGDSASKSVVPVNILGIGGMVSREIMESVKQKLLEIGAIEGSDNGRYLAEIFKAWLER